MHASHTLAARLMEDLAEGHHGRIDLAAWRQLLKDTSTEFKDFARGVFAQLDADADGALALQDLQRARVEDLALLMSPELFDAWSALRLAPRDEVHVGEIHEIFYTDKVDDQTRREVHMLLEGLSELAQGRVTVLTFSSAFDGKSLRTIACAARAALASGYIPPEECETRFDDTWDRRVIFESRKNAGGMSVGQSDVLQRAIKFDS